MCRQQSSRRWRRGLRGLAVHQVGHLGLTHGDARGLRVLEEKVLVDELLPDGVAELLLLLLAGGRGAGHQFVDPGKLVGLGLEVGIADGLAGDLAHVILRRDGLDRLDDLARIDDEEEEREGDQNGKDDAPTAKFL